MSNVKIHAVSAIGFGAEHLVKLIDIIIVLTECRMLMCVVCRQCASLSVRLALARRTHY